MQFLTKIKTLQNLQILCPIIKLINQQSAFYHKNVEELIKNPKNVGSLDKNSPNVGTGIVGSPQCGDVMKLQLEISEDGEIIERAVFKTFGCGSAIASSSYATEQLKGKTLNEAKQLKNSQIADHLKLPPVKIHCSILAEQSIKKAIEDYEKKKKLKQSKK